MSVRAFILISVWVLAAHAQMGNYCSSNCLDFAGTCFSQNYSDTACIVCATSIYQQDPDNNTNLCILNNQTQIVAVDLKTPISLTDFQSSIMAPSSCGTWSLSGVYGQGDYIQKLYQTPSPHYMVIVRYNIMYMGSTWASTNIITVAVDSLSTVLPYKCSSPAVICTTKDCPRIGEVKVSHNSTNATVKFTSNVLNLTGATWGISNLMFVALTCNDQCKTCFGPTSHQCLSCTLGNYLLGNTCVKQCPAMAISTLSICTPACPTTFYTVAALGQCSPCSTNCSVCTGPLESQCVLDNKELTVWQGQEQFWIFLIVLASIVVVVAIAFFFFRRHQKRIDVALNEPIITQEVKARGQQSEMDIKKTDQPQLSIQDQVHIDHFQESSSNPNEINGQAPRKVKHRRWRGKEEC